MEKLTEIQVQNMIEDYQAGMCLKDLSLKYHRDVSTIIGRLKRRGVFQGKKKYWTSEEIETLKENYSCMSIDDICSLLPSRNKNDIVIKASKLHLKNNVFFWNDNEINILKEFYLTEDVNTIAEKLNNKFTISAIKTKAYKLGISQNNYWTEEELQIIRDYYNIKTIDEIVPLIPRHSRKAIIERAMEMGIKSGIFYSKEEEQYIVDNWQKQTDEELSIVLNRPVRSIRDKRLNMGLCRVKHDGNSYSKIYDYLRGNNYEWKKASMENCNYKCVVTDERFSDIHHLYSFKKIVDQVLDRLNITCTEMSSFSEEELNTILKEFKKEQAKYPLGVCLAKDIHIHFHQIYGSGDNTIEQWNEYIEIINQSKS